VREPGLGDGLTGLFADLAEDGPGRPVGEPRSRTREWGPPPVPGQGRPL